MVFLFFFFFTGCLVKTNSFKPLRTEKIIHGSEVYTLLQNKDIFPIFGGYADDEFYLLPSLNWYKEIFHPLIQNQLSTKLFFKESGDCDDFVVLVEAQAIEMNWSNGKAALPVGSFGYKRRDQTRHMVVFFLYNNGGKADIGFYEPQLGGHFIELNQKEMNHVIHWKL